MLISNRKMEIDMQDLVLYNTIYFLFSFFLVYPPAEIQSLGFSIPSLFSSWLGSEQLCFVHHHIMRICITVFIHSMIPLGYYLFMGICMPEMDLFNLFEISIYWRIYLTVSIMVLIGFGTLVYYWTMNDFVNHPICIKLKSIRNSSWKQIANEINVEFRHIDKFSTGTLFNRVYLTDNWLIKVNLYTLYICDNQSVELVLTHSKEVNLTIDGSPSIQYLAILVKPLDATSTIKPFYIHLNSLEYKDFTDKLQAPIRQACDIIIKQSLPEQFLDAFREHVFLNPVYRAKRDVS